MAFPTKLKAWHPFVARLGRSRNCHPMVARQRSAQLSFCSGTDPLASGSKAAVTTLQRVTSSAVTTPLPGVTSPATPGMIAVHLPSPPGTTIPIAVAYVIASDPTATGASSGAECCLSRRRRRRRTCDPWTDLLDARPRRPPPSPFVVVTSAMAPACATTATRTTTGGQEEEGAMSSQGGAVGIDARTVTLTAITCSSTKEAIPGVPFIRPIPNFTRRQRG